MLSFHPLKLIERVASGADAVSLRFEVPYKLREDYQFSAGQHVAVRVRIAGQDLRRTYSIVGGEAAGSLRIVVRVQEQGAVSRFLANELAIDGTIDVMTPAGSFIAPPAAGARRTVVAFAAGSGITPVYSILRALLEREVGTQVLLFYGNRSIARTMLLEELQALKNRFMDRFAVFFVYTREPQDVALLNGRLDAQKLQQLAAGVFEPSAIDQFFLCGPASMIDELSKLLHALNVPASRIHAEHYLSSVQKRRAETQRAVEQVKPTIPTGNTQSEVTVLLAGRRRVFSMSRQGDAILDAAEDAGLVLPYSCRAGVCSTCRTKVVRGKVEMLQNFALEPWELEAGFVLCCQARPMTPVVELTYDEI